MNRRIAIITGGASGVGAAVARMLAANNCNVLINYSRSQDAADKVVEECLALGADAFAFQADVAKDADCRELVAQAVARWGFVDALVNSAGTTRFIPIADLEAVSTEDFEQVFAVNTLGPFQMARAVRPHMPDGAAIVNVSSGLAFVTIAFMPTYCATKAALHAFTMGLRKQLEKTSVKTIEIVPPMVNTGLGGKGLHDAGTPLDVYADDTFARLVAGELEIGFGFSEKARKASREELDQMFTTMNP